MQTNKDRPLHGGYPQPSRTPTLAQRMRAFVTRDRARPFIAPTAEISKTGVDANDSIISHLEGKK